MKCLSVGRVNSFPFLCQIKRKEQIKIYSPTTLGGGNEQAGANNNIKSNQLRRPYSPFLSKVRMAEHQYLLISSPTNAQTSSAQFPLAVRQPC